MSEVTNDTATEAPQVKTRELASGAVEYSGNPAAILQALKDEGIERSRRTLNLPIPATLKGVEGQFTFSAEPRVMCGKWDNNGEEADWVLMLGSGQFKPKSGKAIKCTPSLDGLTDEQFAQLAKGSVLPCIVVESMRKVKIAGEVQMDDDGQPLREAVYNLNFDPALFV